MKQLFKDFEGVAKQLNIDLNFKTQTFQKINILRFANFMKVYFNNFLT